MSFEQARALFPVLERIAYLNAGTFGPLARPTLEAVAARQAEEAEQGRGGRAYFEGVLALRERVRAKLAAQVGVEPEQVALTTSTTDGCNIVLAGLRLGPDDEVVTTDREHFGLLGALGVCPARVRVAEISGRPAAQALELIRAEITPRTRLIALQHVSWVTGHVLPVHELREETGLPVLVDGAQSVGAIDVRASAFEYVTISGQKWLCGPDSTGALVVREPESLAVLAPSYFGQDGYERDGDFRPKEGAARFDTGWLPTPSLAGLEAALDVHPPWRFERAAAMAARCRALLAERFDVVTEPGHATLVSIRPESDPAALVLDLHGAGVVVRDLPGTGLLRVSCGWWTSDDDLERLLAALAARTA
ncbi:MAG: aminotransferase class V-fold PLP-dependent enzyme [Actinobacteria bacterium]|nr:aminotransferase class V-fold PLP-dependent enzyme [Actinomycetota bacterium]